jgi:flagellar hook-associated protein 2
MGITSTGLASGLNIESLVSALVLSEVEPAEQRLIKNEAQFQAKLSAYGTVKNALEAFQTSAKLIGSPSSFQAKSSTTSTYAEVGVEANGNASTGTYNVTVSQLASAHSLASAAFTTTSDTVGTGTLSIALGTTSYNSSTDSYSGFAAKSGTSTVSVTINSSNNTVAGVRDAINAANAGVLASVVNDGSGYRLVMTSATTGAGNSMAISVTDSGDSNNADANGLSRLAFNSASTNLSQTVSASDAALTINGLAVTSSSNQVTTAVDDLTLLLKKVTTAPVSIGISDNTALAKANIESFVKSYNDVIDVLNQFTAYDAPSSSASLLTGDSTIRTLATNIRNMVNTSVQNVGGNYSSLSELGLTTKVTDGKLEIDSTKLDLALKSNPLDVANVFSSLGRPTSSNIRFVSSTSATQSGTYAVAATVSDGVASYTINGQAATKDGTKIIGASGSSVDGLVLEVFGGATSGLGNIAYGIGVASQVDSLIKGLLDDDGLLDARVDGLKASIADIDKQSRALSDQATAIEARYRAQFNGLETLMASLTNTQSFVTAAFENFVDPLAFKK